MGCSTTKTRTFAPALSDEEETDYEISETAEKAETVASTNTPIAPDPPPQTERSARLSQDAGKAFDPPKPELTSSRKSQDLGEFLGSENNPYLKEISDERKNARRRRQSESVEQITQSIQRIQDSIDHTIASNTKVYLNTGFDSEKGPRTKLASNSSFTYTNTSSTKVYLKTGFKAESLKQRSAERPPSTSPADPARLTQGADFPSKQKKKKRDIKDIIYGASNLSPVLLVKMHKASQSPGFGGTAVSLPRSLQRFSASRSNARQMSHTPSRASTPHQLPSTDKPLMYEEQRKKKKKKKKKKRKKKKRKNRDHDFLYSEKKKKKRDPSNSRSRSVRRRLVADPTHNFGGGDMSDTSSEFGARSRRRAPYYTPQSRTVRVKRIHHISDSNSSSSTITPFETRLLDNYELSEIPERKRTPKLSFDPAKSYIPAAPLSDDDDDDVIYPVHRSISSDSDRTISSSFGKYKESLFQSPIVSSRHSKRVVGPSSRIPISNSHSDSEEKVDDSKERTSRSSLKSRRRNRSSEREYTRYERDSDRYSSRKRSYDYRSRDDDRRSNRRRQRFNSDQLSSTFESYRDREYSNTSSRRRQRRDYDRDRRGRSHRRRESDISYDRWRRNNGRNERRRHRTTLSSTNTNRRSARRSFEKLRQKYSFDDTYRPSRKKRTPSPVESPTKGGGNFDSEDDRDTSLSPLRDKPPQFNELGMHASSVDSISTLEDDTLRRHSVQHQFKSEFGGESLYAPH